MWLLCALVCTAGMAQTADGKPVLHVLTFDDGAAVTNLSDNGKWAVCAGASADNANFYTGARLVDVATGQAQTLMGGLVEAEVFSISAHDVTDDGQIVVGQVNSKPGYYNVAEQQWHFVALDGDADCGSIRAVTPDGRYAVGILNYSSEARLYEEKAAMWNLATGELMPLPGIPTADMSHQDQGMNRFTAISADGNKVIGCMSFSYLPTDFDLGGCFYYVYYTDTHTYKPIGFTETTSGRWKPDVEGTVFIEMANLSANGRYATGAAHMSKAIPGSDFPSEYVVPFVFDTETGDFSLYDDEESTSRYGWVIENDGTCYSAGPAANPYRDFGVRSGKFWIDFGQAISQRYGLTLADKINAENSGTLMGISNDGCTFAVLIGPHESYLATLPEPFKNIAASTNLLSNYTVSPTPGVTLSRISTLTLTFDRNVRVAGDATAVELLDRSNNVVANSVGFSSDEGSNVVTITFRKGALEAGSLYRVRIPKGTICLEADATRYNDEIKVVYMGREDAPVQLIEASPKNGNSLGKLDLSTSPVTLTFDTNVLIADGEARGYVYQNNETEPAAELLLAYGDDQVMLYPSRTFYLYKGVDYRVELPAGIVTDVTGNASSANQAISITYHGAYERAASFEENVVFSDDFSDGVANFLVFDNDRLPANDEGKALGFTDVRYGWLPAWDEDDTQNLCAAASSMTTSAGQSDDWMVIPQIDVQDDRYVLSFKAQSYKSTATDKLQVIAYTSNEPIYTLTNELVATMRSEGTLLLDEQLTPGANDEKLAGDWTTYNLPLAAFSGKKVYLAFVNYNKKQSAIFIDDVKVVREQPYYLAPKYESTVVAQSEATVGGVITVAEEGRTFTGGTIRLLNGAGNVIETLTPSGLALTKGQTYEFTFGQPLPLTQGEENAFTISVSLDGVEASATRSVKCLAFSPAKRVVLEEHTGVQCTNCPKGILAAERLKSFYGDLFIPIALHCWGEDPFSSGVSSYNAFLGLSAAPTGLIQRSSEAYLPMYDDGQGNYEFTAPEGSTMRTWQTVVAGEMEKATEAEVTATASLSADGKRYTVPCQVRYAMNASDLNLKLFAVVLENGLVGYQSNGYSAVSHPNLGEWGKGGRYGKPSVSPYTHNHVARGTVGRSFTGTEGLLPTTMVAGQYEQATLSFDVPATVSDPQHTDIVVMLFDGNTDRLINAYLAPVQTAEAIDHVGIANASVEVSATAGCITVRGTGALQAEVYTADGRLIATASGQGTLRIGTAGYRGVALVRTGSQVTKVAIR